LTLRSSQVKSPCGPLRVVRAKAVMLEIMGGPGAAGGGRQV
jgi:hypothetical protein